jgi:hypothetical protein
MKARLGLVVCAGAMVVGVWAGPASAMPVGPPENASGPPVGGCPQGAGSEWFLVRPSGPEHTSAQYDFNNDGVVCARWLPAFDGQSGVAFKDNVKAP